MPDPSVQVVWFRRDLRVHDHAPLAEAALHGPVLPLYIAEPRVLAAPDADPTHWMRTLRSLAELRMRLAECGQPLVVRVGTAMSVLEALRRTVPFAVLWSYEEAGNAASHTLDRSVAAWARYHAIPWYEVPQTGVVRRPRDRDAWVTAWERVMRAPQASTPPALQPVHGVAAGPLPEHRALEVVDHQCTGA